MTPSAEFKSTIAITHVTTATAVLEIDGVKFITDPIFDEAPRDYDLSHLAGMKPREVILSVIDGPKVGIKQLPVIDCVLLSHEDHVDNLDETGLQLLISRQVITTPDGAKNLSEYPGVSMGGTDAVRMCEILEPDVLVPMYFESWTHFTQDGQALREDFNAGGISDKVKSLTSGAKVQII
ncbi:hypothetical protein NW761_015146 [Fusarium oxysporum]|nr:hypothetical protein NW758_015144 [Fusarium oxysporum]KAJ4069068.1 hypothetical protein NW761_015146 [Fusarium oxysporum]KAJ4127346.1 hypothetical protein NW765_017298 [Fusarium oxysporum]KAJ4245963.1 hypothetical protein NW764_016548 [Fusarium oxysporum]